MRTPLFRWGTITQVAPLRVQLDGDVAALPITPDSLVDPSSMSVGDRVRAELSLNRVIIHGAANGGGPSGEIKITAAAAAPAGWLLAQGQSLLRASYPRLFAVLGTTYGAADSTHFSVPDMRGRVAVGYDGSDAYFYPLGVKSGQKTTNEGFTLPGINSGQAQVGGSNYEAAAIAQLNGWLTSAGGSTATVIPSIQAVGGAIQGTGSGNIEVHHGRYTSPNMQPYIALNYIIKT